METTANATIAASIVEQAPDAVIFAGTDGLIQVWNTAATEMFGFPAAEAMGQSLDIIIPENFREQHWTGYDRALAAGDTKYRGQAMPTKALKSDGSTFYVELSFAIIKDESGTVIGALAHARDITERFERDRTSRRRLRELEQQVKELAATEPATS
jgi:PAS domain S-box-containing protein